MERQPAPEDRRAFSLALTPKGRSDLTRISAVVQEQDQRVISGLSTAEQTELHRLLIKLCAIPD